MIDLKAKEIIVDNEDDGFRLIEPKQRLLRALLFKESEYTESYPQGPPVMNRWHKIYGSNYHGNGVRSAIVKTDGTGGFKAEWKAELPEEGQYEIFVWSSSEKYKAKEYHYTVSGKGMTPEEVALSTDEEGWVSLGQFDLKAGTSFVVLDDRAPKKKPTDKQEQRFSMGQRIIADAVKWVRIGECAK